MEKITKDELLKEFNLETLSDEALEMVTGAGSAEDECKENAWKQLGANLRACRKKPPEERPSCEAEYKRIYQVLLRRCES